MFLSKPILQTLSKHLSFVSRAEIDWNEEISGSPPLGAIAMAAAAVSSSVCSLCHCSLPLQRFIAHTPCYLLRRRKLEMIHPLQETKILRQRNRRPQALVGAKGRVRLQAQMTLSLCAAICLCQWPVPLQAQQEVAPQTQPSSSEQRHGANTSNHTLMISKPFGLWNRRQYTWLWRVPLLCAWAASSASQWVTTTKRACSRTIFRLMWNEYN